MATNIEQVMEVVLEFALVVVPLAMVWSSFFVMWHFCLSADFVCSFSFPKFRQSYLVLISPVQKWFKLCPPTGDYIENQMKNLLPALFVHNKLVNILKKTIKKTKKRKITE